MSDAPKELLPFHEVLRTIGRWLDAAGVEGAIIGGVAVAFIGRARVTRDVDLLIWLAEESWSEFLRHGVEHGFVSRFSDPLEFAARSRLFSVRHVASGITVDLSLGILDFEHEMIRQATVISVAGSDLRVLRPEDLILLKAFAKRDQDILDIAGLVAKHPLLDRKYLREQARLIEQMLDESGFVERVDQLTLPKK